VTIRDFFDVDFLRRLFKHFICSAAAILTFKGVELLVTHLVDDPQVIAYIQLIEGFVVLVIFAVLGVELLLGLIGAVVKSVKDFFSAIFRLVVV
jgi:hypothetical protein